MATLTRHTGLGFRIFGKEVKLGTQLRKLCNTIVEEVCTKFLGSTLGGVAADTVKGWLKTALDSMEKSLNQYKTVTASITAAEIKIIENWANEKLTPFAKNMAEQANAIAAMSSTAQKVAAINGIETTIDALQDYLGLGKEATGLSLEGVNQRAVIIYWAFYPIHQLLVEYATQMQLIAENDVTVSTANINVSSLITGQLNATTKTTKYTAPAVSATPITNPNTLPAATLPTTTPAASVLPATNTSPSTAVSSATIGGGKTNAVTQNVGSSQATLQNTSASTAIKTAINNAKAAEAAKTASDSNAALIIGGVVVAGVLYMAFKGGNKKATGMNGRRALNKRRRKTK